MLSRPSHTYIEFTYDSSKSYYLKVDTGGAPSGGAGHRAAHRCVVQRHQPNVVSRTRSGHAETGARSRQNRSRCHRAAVRHSRQCGLDLFP